MELLSTTSMKVAAVARRVGFEDVGYFGKVFRKYTGITPGQYEQVTYQLGDEGKKLLFTDHIPQSQNCMKMQFCETCKRLHREACYCEQ